MIALILVLSVNSYIPEPYQGFWDTRVLSNALIQKGYDLLTQGDYREAYEAFKVAKSRVWGERDLFAATLGLAISAFYTGRPDEVKAGFKKAFYYATDPADSALAAMWNVYALYQWGEYQEAAALVEKFKDMFSRYDPAMVGLVYISVNMPDSAIRYVKGSDLDALYIRGYANFMIGDYKEAVKLFQKCVMMGENEFLYPYAIYMLGESYHMLGEPKKAAETFEKLAFIYTGASITEKAIFASAYLYDSLGMVEKADSLIDILLSWYRPEGDFGNEVRFKRAEILIEKASRLPWHDPARRKMVQKAIAMLDSLKEITEDLADDVLFLKATAYYRIWDHYDAERLFEYGASYYPNSEHYEDFLFGGGRSAYYLGDYDKAITLLSPLTRHSVYSYEASYYLGMAFYKTGRSLDRAIRYLKYASRSDNRRYRALSYKALGDIYLSMDSLQLALNYYQNALKTNGLTSDERSDVTYSIEYIRYNMGEYAGLVDFALKFSAEHPDNRYTPVLIFNALSSADISKSDAIELLGRLVRVIPFDTLTFRSFEVVRGKLNAIDVEPILDTLLSIASKRYYQLLPSVFAEIARTYEKYGLYYKAISAYNFALHRAIAIKDTALEPEIRFYIAKNYLRLNDYSTSMAQFDTAYQQIMKLDTLPGYFLDFMKSYVNACLKAGDTVTVYRVSGPAIRAMNSVDRLEFINFLSSNGIDIISTGQQQSATDAWYMKMPIPGE